MSKKFNFFFSFFIIFTISNNILGETIFWEIDLLENPIKPGDKGVAFLTIYINDAPKDKIDFDNTVIIGIDLKNPDPTFKVQVHKFESKEDKEIYKIDFISEKLGKNEFIITYCDLNKNSDFYRIFAQTQIFASYLDKYIETLNQTAEANHYEMVCLYVTDIIKNGSYVLFNEKAKNYIEVLYGIENPKEGLFIEGCISRKKNIVPLVMNIFDN